MIPTPHIELKDKDLIAKTVLMPGDPLRAKFIAETFLTNVVQINGVRNMFGYTGYYNKKKVTFIIMSIKLAIMRNMAYLEKDYHMLST